MACKTCQTVRCSLIIEIIIGQRSQQALLAIQRPPCETDRSIGATRRTIADRHTAVAISGTRIGISLNLVLQAVSRHAVLSTTRLPYDGTDYVLVIQPHHLLARKRLHISDLHSLQTAAKRPVTLRVPLTTAGNGHKLAVRIRTTIALFNEIQSTVNRRRDLTQMATVLIHTDRQVALVGQILVGRINGLGRKSNRAENLTCLCHQVRIGMLLRGLFSTTHTQCLL